MENSNAIRKYQWAGPGDWNAYFGLLLDNIAGLVLMVGLLVGGFGMPADFVLSRMVPGTAVGVLVGDLLYFWLAFRLARKSGRDVTAMPLGLDTPSIFGISIFVVGAAYASSLNAGNAPEAAARFAWNIGICCMFYAGLLKIAFSFCGNWIRKVVPRAGLFGSLASIALVIISFVPLVDIVREPLPGMVALAIVLTSLIGKVPVPGKIPGTLMALLVGGCIHYLQRLVMGEPLIASDMVLTPGYPSTLWMETFGLDWWQQMGAAANYLPVAIPFALCTVVGGIDCTESAAAAGDEYSTGQILGVEAIATLAAGFCGGVIQTTPYIGHPAYKAMGGRAAYVLGTALTLGVIGLIGGFSYFYLLVPKSVVYPILIFVGLEISSQSFLATPKRHYPALVLACVPSLAFLAYLFADQVLGSFGIVSIQNSVALRPDVKEALDSLALLGNEASTDPNLVQHTKTIQSVFSMRPDLRSDLQTVQLIKNGFILTSLLWASFLAMAIDRRMFSSALYLTIAGVFTLFGLIHCPLSSNALFLPFSIPGLSESWVLPSNMRGTVFQLAFGYFLTACLMIAWGVYLRQSGQTEPVSDE